MSRCLLVLLVLAGPAAAGPSAKAVLAAKPLPLIKGPAAVVSGAAAATLTPALPALSRAGIDAAAVSAPAAAAMPGEDARSMAAAAFDAAPFKASPADVAGLSSLGAAPLAPAAADRRPSSPEPRAPKGSVARVGLRERLAVRANYSKRWLQEYYWYNVTHIVDMWPSYKKRWSEARAAGYMNVSSPRAFFTHMRTVATSGRFYVLGAAPVSDEAVVVSMLQAYLTWFNGAALGKKEFAAYSRFTDRAFLFNEERRAPSNMRKHLRDALIKASTMEPSKIAPFFDSLLVEQASIATQRFQKEHQAEVLEAFRQAVLDTLAEEEPGAQGEILAGILMGSFASGSAGPRSDLDMEVMTRGGKDGRVEAFTERLIERWGPERQKLNPIGVHEHAYKPYRGVIELVHSAEYLVISRDEELRERLQRKYGEKPSFAIDRRHTYAGFAGRALQNAIILSSTFLGDAKAALFGASAPSH